MERDDASFRLEKALKAFWKDHGKTIGVNARHTVVNVEPKFIVGNRVNPDVAKKIIGVYLSQLNSDKIVKEEIGRYADDIGAAGVDVHTEYAG